MNASQINTSSDQNTNCVQFCFSSAGCESKNKLALPICHEKNETLQSYSVQGRFHRLSILWEYVVTNLGFVV